MLNFLRKLRRNNMKNSQYFQYAFGEIILVVVGILIALGINNWNEERKTLANESRLLQKVKAENDYNLQILLDDTAYFRGIDERIFNLALRLKEPQSPKRDSLIGMGLNDALRVTTLEFSDEYLSRYINSSENDDGDFIFDFIELKDTYGSVETSSEFPADFKFKNILSALETSIDFVEGEILDMKQLEDWVFVNRLIILSSIEESRSYNIFNCIDNARKVDSLLNIRLGLSD